MNTRFRTATCLFAFSVILASSQAIGYAAKLLHPVSGYSGSSGWGSNGYNQVGVGNSTSGNRALLWYGSPTSVVDLTPFGTTAEAYAAYGAVQVGMSNSRACLWYGSASSYVNLHPAGWDSSSARGVYGYEQVGVCRQYATNSIHAFKWSGSSASAVDLHPIGYNTSEAHAVDASGRIAGVTTVTTLWWTNLHAALWNSSGGFTDLNPYGFNDTIAYAVDGSIQGGYGAGPSTSYYTHALLWSGTPSSVVDVHPSSLQESGIMSCSYGLSAGWGIYPSSFDRHAFLWTGATPLGAMDLHSLLTGLSFAGAPLTFVSSIAICVDGKGNVIGSGTTTTGATYAILWQRTP